MATTAETHKTMAALMAEDLVKPLRAFADSQHKSRKNIEGNVDKTARSLLGIWILLRIAGFKFQNLRNAAKSFKVIKVQILWEGHKKLSLCFDITK